MGSINACKNDFSSAPLTDDNTMEVQEEMITPCTSMDTTNLYKNDVTVASPIKDDTIDVQEETITNINPVQAHRKRHLKVSSKREHSLTDIRQFKPTRQVAKSLLRILHMNLIDFISWKYLLVRKEVLSKTVKTYLFLIFNSGTDLQWMRRIVHNIFPFVEIDGQCKTPDCTCKASRVGKPRVVKRRGFGYICEDNIEETIATLKKQGYVVSVEYLPWLKKQEKRQRPQLKRLSCNRCEFIGRSQLGFNSHQQKHEREAQQRELSEVGFIAGNLS
jgi:hypothetical protein